MSSVNKLTIGTAGNGIRSWEGAQKEEEGGVTISKTTIAH